MTLLALLAPFAPAALLHTVVYGIVLALICYLLFWAMGYLGVPEPIRKVVTVIIVVLVVVWLLSTFLL